MADSRRLGRKWPGSHGIAGVVGGLVLVAMLALHAPATAQSSTVSIVDFGFAPATVQATMVPPEPAFLQAHAHVLFTNNGRQQHNVTFDDGRILSSPTLNPGQFFDAVITVVGTFSYHCSIHPSMEGRITVAPLPTTTTTDPPLTAPPTTAPPIATTVATAAPVKAARPLPTTTTTRPLPTTTRPAPGVTTTTTAAPTPTTAPAVTTTEPPSSSTTTADVADRVNVAAGETGSDPPGWPLLVLLIVLIGGAALFVGRIVVSRRRRPVDDL